MQNLGSCSRTYPMGIYILTQTPKCSRVHLKFEKHWQSFLGWKPEVGVGQEKGVWQGRPRTLHLSLLQGLLPNTPSQCWSHSDTY